ncbi:MAG: glycerol-3-phosphate 1-O-acyltransferase PlsY [Hyphomonadaceae bacterium]|nr:glycerol-3-phosphate 1-O-acyltransferase PlsY [Hyphomonadaceae bacterium]
MGDLTIFAAIASAALGYLLGSIPFGLVITKAAGLGDIREIGSGNIGATNVLRTGRKDLALATFLLDSGKAAIALLLAKSIFPTEGGEAGFIAGGAAFLGHCFPVWLKFKGGKGVATFFGVLFAGLPLIGAACAALWVLTALLFRMSSLGALVAAAAAPVLAYFLLNGPIAIGFCVLLAVLIYVRHHANISRILAGTEPKIGAKKAAEEPKVPEPTAE